MNLLAILKEAQSMIKRHMPRIIYIYLFIEILTLFVNLMPNQVIAIVLGVLLTTVPHAYVFTSLKLINHQEETIALKDAVVGFKDFARLFPSYMMRKVILNVVSLGILLPAILLIRFQTGFAIGEFLDWIRMIVVSGMDDLTGITVVQGYLNSMPVILSLCLSGIVTMILSYGLSLMPYLVQDYEISWFEAIQKSWKMMKGHKIEMFVLKMAYVPIMLLVYLTIVVVGQLLAFSPTLCLFVSLVMSIYLPIMLYLPQMEVAMALFYQKLQQQQKQPDLFAL